MNTKSHKIYSKRNLLLLLLILVGLACKHQAPDFSRIDREISAGHLKQAENVLHKAAQYTYSDSLVQKRIRYRLFKIEKRRFFKKADLLIQRAQWQKAGKVLDSLTTTVEKLAIGKKRKYLFDLFYKKYMVRSGLNDTVSAFANLKKAVLNWTDNRELLQKAFTKLAFYYAQQGQLIEAREMMDKALRMYDINNLNPQLRSVFFKYMEGRFKEAEQVIERIESNEKKGTWRQLEIFLKKYGVKLTLKDRFKLW